MALATKALKIYLQCFLGEPTFAHETVVNYQNADTDTGAVVQDVLINVPVSTTDQQVVLATYFPNISNCRFIVVQDLTNPGQQFSFATDAGSNRVPVQAGAFVAWVQDGGAPKSLYLTNPSATTASDILISVVSL